MKQEQSQEFIGNTISAALRQVKAAFGPDAIILSQHEAAGKVSIVALPSHAALPMAANAEPANKTMPIVSLFAKADEDVSQDDDIFSATYLRAPIDKKQYEIRDEISEYIKVELASIKELISQNVPKDEKPTSESVLNPHHVAVLKVLNKAKLITPFISHVLTTLPPDLSLEQTWEYIIDKMVGAIPFDSNHLSSKKIKSLVGPSGAGKSLLLAKLLIYYANRPLRNNFAIIFVNNNNLKVLEESKVYARLFNVPCYYVENTNELEVAFERCQEVEHVFIDFPAYDFNFSENNYYVNFLRNYREQIDNVLVVSAHYPYGYVERFYNAFQENLIDAISITKLDETNACEEIINFIINHPLPVRNLSFGSLNFMQGFSSRLMFADKEYFKNYLTRTLVSAH